MIDSKEQVVGKKVPLEFDKLKLLGKMLEDDANGAVSELHARKVLLTYLVDVREGTIGLFSYEAMTEDASKIER